VAVGNACSSGTDAIGLGRQWILDGLCDVVIAGGCDELCRTPYLGFTALLNTSTEPCRPFDRDRKGLNLGEGAGVLILESEDHAAARKARALGRVSGFGNQVDAHHATAPHPEGRGLRAGLTPADIDFVNTHGTATPSNDAVEGKTVAALYGPDIVMVSTKGATGHALGAAGGIEAIFTLLALRDKKVSPTLGFENVDPAVGIPATRAVTPIRGRAGVSNNLAFGGQNSVLVFQPA
jgi:3-oxoacyl-(acyl-carrier-protein) synthase